MNTVVLVGRLTKDPETRYTQGENPMAITRYTLAVDRRFAREGEQTADFIPCVSFGKSAEFSGKYFTKGMRVTVRGRIQTGSYVNRDNVRVYTTDVVVEDQEFAQSRGEAGGTRQEAPQEQETRREPFTATDEFMQIPEGIDEELPFN